MIAGPESIPPGGPRWRTLLEARWRARLQDVTELSLAYHDAAGGLHAGSRQSEPSLRSLLEWTVAARRALADTEDALGRLAAGRFGRCEYCSSEIPPEVLGKAPESRYCPHCDRGPGQDGTAARQGRRGQAPDRGELALAIPVAARITASAQRRAPPAGES